MDEETRLVLRDLAVRYRELGEVIMDATDPPVDDPPEPEPDDPIDDPPIVTDPTTDDGWTVGSWER
jgi:hypothetical protein